MIWATTKRKKFPIEEDAVRDCENYKPWGMLLLIYYLDILF